MPTAVATELLHEAGGLLADVLVDPALPRHLVAGLRAVAGLLRPLADQAAALTGGGRSAGGALRGAGGSVGVSLSDTALPDWPYDAETLVYPPRVSAVLLLLLFLSLLFL